MKSGIFSGKPHRADGRRAFLAYLDPEVIKGLKMAALDHGTPAYEIVEVALKEWLQKNSQVK